MVGKIRLNHRRCAVDTLEAVMQFNQQFRDIKAGLFLSSDADVFLRTHKGTFLDTLARCLQTQQNNITFFNIADAPFDE